jgi:hypothetical protein
MKIKAGKPKIKLKKITIDELAAMVQKGFSDMQRQINDLSDKTEKRFDAIEYEVAIIKQTMATKDDIEKIHAHLGRFEMRFQKIEDIVINDHRPRIQNLEKAVGI